jgi:DNA (cytosine-5)-methyltransferase 1
VSIKQSVKQDSITCLECGKPGKTLCEFFAGIGLVGEGLAESGWQCVFANDSNPVKRSLYVARNQDTNHYVCEDVRETDKIAKAIPGKPFLATASFPCIDLSLAGHYRGFKGEHSSTFFAFVDVLQRLGRRQPKAIMLENVAGFLTSRSGDDFREAVTTLAELGFWIDAFIIDAVHFVPQSRPRVIVVALKRSLVRRKQVAAAERSETWHRPKRLLKLMATIDLATGWLGMDLPMPPPREISLSDMIDVDSRQDWWNKSQVERHYKMMSDRHRVEVDERIANRSDWVGTIFRRIRHGHQRAEVRFDGVAGCLRTPSGGSARQIVIVVKSGELKMRWMSPREYSRLQGVHDFPLDGRTNQLLWAFGDAVCVPAIEWVDRHVLTPAYDRACQQKVKRRSHA